VLRKYPLLFFFLLAYAISWFLWAPLLLAKQGIIFYQPPQYLHLLGSLGPAIAALIMTRVCGGSVGLQNLWQRMFDWRVSLVWYAIAGLPLLLFFISVLLTGWNNWESQSFGHSAEYPELPVAIYWFVSILCYGWGEETGWRGFALPYLQTRQSALQATITLSIGWAFWHLPLFGFSPGFSQMGIVGVIGWYFSILTGAVLLTWLTNSTRGNILIAALFHGIMDIAFISAGSSSVANILGALITIWGIAVLSIAKPQYLSRVGKVVVNQEHNSYRIFSQGQHTT
jgi:uncharacterized protein